MRSPVAMALLAAGCSASLLLPGEPRADLQLTGVLPAAAHAGTLVRLSGAHLGARPADVSVSFGAAPAVHPRAVSADQRSLDVVVPDAAFGPALVDVTVTTPEGSVTRKDALSYLGGDRLRMGQVALVQELGPVFVQAAGLPGPGKVLAVSQRETIAAAAATQLEAWLLQAQVSIELRPFLAQGPVRLAASADGRRVAALTVGDAAGCAQGAPRLDLYDGDAITDLDGASDSRLASACVDAVVRPEASLVGLSLSPDGGTALVMDGRHAVIADLSGGAPALRALAAGAGMQWTHGVALDGGVVVLGGGLDTVPVHFLHAEGPAGPLGDDWAVNRANLGVDVLGALCAAPGGAREIAAAGTFGGAGTGTTSQGDSGVVTLLSVAQWPPAVRRTLVAPEDSPSAIAYSSDGATLAALDANNGVFLSWSLARPTPLPWAREALAGRGLAADPYGAFLVPGPARVWHLDAAGNSIGERRLDVDTFAVAFGERNERADAGGASHVGWNLSLAGRRFDALGLLDAGVPDSLRWAPVGGEPVAQALLPDGHGLVVARRTGAGDDLVLLAQDGAWKALPALPAEFRVSALAVTPDAAALIVYDGAALDLRVLALGGDGRTLARVTAESPSGWDTPALFTWADGRAALVRADLVDFFRWSDPAWTGAPADLALTPGELVTTANHALFAVPGRLLEIDLDGTVTALSTADGKGAVVRNLPANIPLSAVAAASPGGTRLYWAASTVLLTLQYDPVENRVGQLEPPVLLPADNHPVALAVAPDGESIALLSRLGRFAGADPEGSGSALLLVR